MTDDKVTVLHEWSAGMADRAITLQVSNEKTARYNCPAVHDHWTRNGGILFLNFLDEIARLAAECKRKDERIEKLKVENESLLTFLRGEGERMFVDFGMRTWATDLIRRYRSWKKERGELCP